MPDKDATAQRRVCARAGGETGGVGSYGFDGWGR